MKILHTADIHLDSKMTRHFDKDRAKTRRNELLATFNNMVNYAAKEGVTAIIIAGDLFDVPSVSATARNSVLAGITSNPEITFFYLRGNHDATGFIQDVIKKQGELPRNLKLFENDWTSYTLEEDGVEVVITGAEMTHENNRHLVDSLVLDQSKFNIVTLHGQEIENSSDKKAEVIPGIHILDVLKVEASMSADLVALICLRLLRVSREQVHQHSRWSLFHSQKELCMS